MENKNRPSLAWDIIICGIITAVISFIFFYDANKLASFFSFLKDNNLLSIAVWLQKIIICGFIAETMAFHYLVKNHNRFAAFYLILLSPALIFFWYAPTRPSFIVFILLGFVLLSSILTILGCKISKVILWSNWLINLVFIVWAFCVLYFLLNF